jgi:imidazolonepropionase-like amidohydrolase
MKHWLFLLLAACSTPPPRKLVVRAGKLLDGTGGPAQTPAQTTMRVTILDGVIAAIEPDTGEPPAELHVVDLRNATVMPGLIDAHLHVTGSSACTPGVGVGLGQIVRNLHALVAGGITTAADLAEPLDVALGVRGWVGTARHRGPRLLVAGPMLTTSGGYLTDLLHGELVERGMVQVTDSPEQAIAHVQELAEAGVDLIKLGMQEYNYSREPLKLPSAETVCAVVEEAHRQELRAVIHATTNATYKLAIDCKADAIVHGCLEPLEPSLPPLVAARQMSVAPTIYVFEAPLAGAVNAGVLKTPGAARVLSDEVRADLESYQKAAAAAGDKLPDNAFAKNLTHEVVSVAAANNRANTATLHALGVPLALGTDAGFCFGFVGEPGHELRRLEMAGLPRPKIVEAATSGSARLIGLGDAIGRVAVGYRADLIGVDGDPYEDLAALEKVRTVIIDGVEQHVEEPDWSDTLGLGLRLLWSKIVN